MSRQQRRRERAAKRTPVRDAPATKRRPKVLDVARRTLHRAVRRRAWLIAGGLVLLHLLVGLLTFEPRPHTGGDNAAYISLGTALLERGAYVELWDPAEPPHTKYPPVFPAILAIALAAGLEPFVQLKLVVLLFSATAVGFSFLWIRERRRPLLALGTGLLLALAPGVLREGRWILSDVPFWCFTMIALWAFQKLRSTDRARFAVGAAAVLLAYFTRSAGLPLVVAALAWLAWQRQWRRFALLAVLVGVPAVAWWLRARAFGPAGYVSEFWLINPYVPAAGTIGLSDLFARIGANAGKYTSIHLPILLAGRQAVLLSLISAVVFALALWGWVTGVRRAAVAHLFLPLYLGLILVWPDVWSGERFLLPALPLVLFFAGVGLRRIMLRAAPRHEFVAATAAVALLIALMVPATLASASMSRECTARYRAGERFPCMPGEHWEDFFAMAEWTRTALPPDATILNRKPRLFFVLSGLRSANYPLSSDDGAFTDAVQSAGARYVVFDRLDAVSDMYLRPVLLRRPEAFCLLHVLERTGTVLFGIDADRLAETAGPVVSDGDVRFGICDASYHLDGGPGGTRLDVP